MNYITKIQTENKALKEGLNDLLAYVRSSKFAIDPMVNSADIVLRIQEIQSELNQIG